MSIRLRFAPSPTGFLHVGGLRTALYNYFFARKNNGKFILRIEDTDQNRKVDGATEKLCRIFKKLKIDFDEGPIQGGSFGPYYQSKRLDLYKGYVHELLDKGFAYPCFCTPDRLDNLRKEKQKKNESTKYDRFCLKLSKKERANKLANQSYVIRLKVPDEQKIEFTDLVRGDIKFNTSEIDDQVLLKSDGYPTYHLANVIDDYEMRISHVIRGEEWLSSTPKHILLYRAFGWEIPNFAHLPLLLNSDKSKLSKRQGDVAVEDYLSNGFISEAIVNFVSLLGWNPGNDQEIFSLNELVEKFSIERIQKGGAVFDREKLSWMNGLYIRELEINKIVDLSKPYFDQKGIDVSNKEKFIKVIQYVRNRVTRLDQVFEESKYFYNHLYADNDKEGLLKENITVSLFKFWIDELSGKVFFGGQEINNLVKISSDKFNLKGKNLFFPLRLALYGKCAGPDIGILYDILGKEEVLFRLSCFVNE